jgi:ribosomal protein S18 acetylase RimI-like enzyme
MTSPLAIAIRSAREADAVALSAILHDTYETKWLPHMTPAAAKAFRDEDRAALYVASRGIEFLVAECGGELVGLVDWDADFVNALHVRSNYARRGIGGQLMDLAEAAMAKAGFRAARLETDTFNTRSRAFYEARGYLEADRYPDTEWDSGFTTILLVKALN